MPGKRAWHATALAGDMAPRYRDGRDRTADAAGGWRRHSPARETWTTVAVRRTRERTRTKSARAIVASGCHERLQRAVVTSGRHGRSPRAVATGGDLGGCPKRLPRAGLLPA